MGMGATRKRLRRTCPQGYSPAMLGCHWTGLPSVGATSTRNRTLSECCESYPVLAWRRWTPLDEKLVERKGIEPSTFALRTRRSPN